MSPTILPGIRLGYGFTNKINADNVCCQCILLFPVPFGVIYETIGGCIDDGLWTKGRTDTRTKTVRVDPHMPTFGKLCMIVPNMPLYAVAQSPAHQVGSGFVYIQPGRAWRRDSILGSWLNRLVAADGTLLGLAVGGKRENVRKCRPTPNHVQQATPIRPMGLLQASISGQLPRPRCRSSVTD